MYNIKNNKKIWVGVVGAVFEPKTCSSYLKQNIDKKIECQRRALNPRPHSFELLSTRLNTIANTKLV